jgi:hypothetical protein
VLLLLALLQARAEARAGRGDDAVRTRQGCPRLQDADAETTTAGLGDPLRISQALHLHPYPGASRPAATGGVPRPPDHADASQERVSHLARMLATVDIGPEGAREADIEETVEVLRPLIRALPDPHLDAYLERLAALRSRLPGTSLGELHAAL